MAASLIHILGEESGCRSSREPDIWQDLPRFWDENQVPAKKSVYISWDDARHRLQLYYHATEMPTFAILVLTHSTHLRSDIPPKGDIQYTMTPVMSHLVSLLMDLDEFELTCLSVHYTSE